MDPAYPVYTASCQAVEEMAEKTAAPEIVPNDNAISKKELENACFTLQDKVLERLLLSEMKLKVLENQMFIIWNKMTRRRWNSRHRNFSRRRRRTRRKDSTFSIISNYTTNTLTECD